MRGFEHRKRTESVNALQKQASFDLAKSAAGRQRDQRCDPTQTAADRLDLQRKRNRADLRLTAPKARMEAGQGSSREDGHGKATKFWNHLSPEMQKRMKEVVQIGGKDDPEAWTHYDHWLELKQQDHLSDQGQAGHGDQQADQPHQFALELLNGAKSVGDYVKGKVGQEIITLRSQYVNHGSRTEESINANRTYHRIRNEYEFIKKNAHKEEFPALFNSFRIASDSKKYYD